MSPRRMDISSLLCNDLSDDDDDDDPSTAHSAHSDRPRTIDALLHHPPSSSSLLSILNNPDPTVSPSNRTRRLSRPSPLTHASPPSSPSTTLHRPTSSHSYSPTEHRQNHPYVHPTHTTQRSPFLGLDALVHVASEERRRISSTSTTSPTTTRSEREADSEHYRDRRLEQDTYPHIRPHVSLVHDHERHSRHYSHPPTLASTTTHPHQHHPPPSEDNARPHKRVRDVCSPSPLDSQPGSASTQVLSHSSASTLNDDATARRQPAVHMDATRSAPGLLVAPPSDLRGPPQTSSSLPPSSPPVSSPFFQSHHPLHVNTPTLQSPRNHSPHRHSPQQLRSHYSPTQASLAMSPSPAVEAMSPRFGHGPRMAGGISVLTNNSPPVRDLPTPGSSSIEGIRREAPWERFTYEIPVEHAQLPLQAPVPRLAVSVRDDKPHAIREVQISSSKVEGMGGVLREQTQSRHPPPLPVYGSGQSMGAHEAMHVRELSHPIRVWEEQPERPRRISPPPIAPVFHPVSDPAKQISEERMQLEISPMNDGMRNDDGPIEEDVVQTLREGVAGKLPTPSFHTCRESSPPSALLEASVAPKASASESQPPSQKSHVDSKSMSPTPAQSLLSVCSEPQGHLSEASPPKVSSPCSPYIDASVTPCINLHVGPPSQSDLGPPDAQVMPGVQTSPPPSGPITSELLSSGAKLIAEPPALDLSMTTVVTQQETSEHPQLGPVHDPAASKVSEPSSDSETMQSKTWSPSQQPRSVLVPVKEEQNTLPEGIPPSVPNQPDPSPGQSPEPVSDHEPSVPESSMMDVDEELLSLVEDAPVCAIPTVPKSQVKSNLASPLVVQGPGPNRGLSEASGSSQMPSSHSITKAHLTMANEDKDRASMPPPAPRTKKTEKEKGTTGTATGSKKKKDATSKQAPAKPKLPPKPRAKPAPKTKTKLTVVDAPSKSAVLKGGPNTNARSRSASVLPGAAEDPVPEPEAEESEREDDKLYCVCKTRYDEDRMMIACDRCDEWFHTHCVKMPDLEIDLVDQFVCPPCIQKNPHLRTTWKRRCLFGLKHENPSAPDACHKPSRGAFSKYCSDECGIKYMQTHIARWENSGGTRDLLWESVKNATKREGVVVHVETNSPGKMDVDSGNSQPKKEPLDAAAKRRAEREVAHLGARLEPVVKEREIMKRDLDMVLWREKVVDLASERAERVDECGWDQRLCFGEEEWTDFGADVLESYEEERTKAEPGDDAMPLDGSAASHGEWWCTGKKKCERHAGWQKLRTAEVSFDKETKETILLKLTTQEREIRKRIEDILYPQSNNPSKPLHPESQLNGSGQSRPLGNVSERGKKQPF